VKYLWLAIVAVIVVNPPKAPPLLEQALLRHPDLKILDPPADLVGGYTIDELRQFHVWPPWVVRDVDRDGRPDVVAVVVRRATAGSEFGVIAVHARTPTVVQWVVPLGPEIINGVGKGLASETVTPLFCIECDTNRWFRWSGRSYEADLQAVGERIAIATYEPQPLGLRAMPGRDARLVLTLAPCTRATVRVVAGSEQDRWCFVETRGPHPVRGWIPAVLVSHECS
jgi:hypothetical protein